MNRNRDDVNRKPPVHGIVNRSHPEKRKLEIGITGVPFGRTELSLRLSVSKFCTLSHEHGPKDWFLVFFKGKETGTVF